jgi:sterol desaturase/sphingolipid hydroxylase (fatty acid hydroxylase superfamily)
MDDLLFGKRNKRGDWSPDAPAGLAPLFVFPPRPFALLRWLPHYFVPYNLLIAASAVAWWRWVLPDVETMKTLDWGWTFRLFIINCVAVVLFYGAFELRLYILRNQGTRFKYNGKWPAEQRSKAFCFERQNVDNIMRTFGSGVTIWTVIEVIILHAFATGWARWLTFAQDPWYLGLLFLLVPVIHETHFFLFHRAIHWPLLYKWVHSVHHNSVNPSPWSSLSMHPIEHLGFFGVAFWHLIIPSNPIIALFQLHFSGFGAVLGHVGFDKVEITETTAIDSHAYIHYLHHKYFEVNYGDGLIPFDKWFGTFHDGSKEAEERMQARYEKTKARLNAKATA